MKNKTTLLLLSLLLALGTAGGALFWLKGQEGIQTKKVETAELWVAKDTIPSGTEITEEMLAKSTVPKTEIPDGALNKQEYLVGKFSKETIFKGEGFPSQRLYTEADKLLSLRLEPGYRAFSITMTQFGAVADLLRPGDRVDIFVYLKELQGTETSVRPDIAKLLLQNIEVLAIRKETQKETPPPEELPDIYAVTLAVPVKDIEKLFLAEETGIMKVALRPNDDESTYASYGVVWQELLLDKDLNIRNMAPEYKTVDDLNKLNQAILNQTQPTAPQPGTTAVSPVGSNGQPATQPTTTTKPTNPTVVKKYDMYTVQPGDTLMSISRKFFNGSASHYDDIMKINGLKDATLKPGQKLKIPVSGR